MGSTGFDGGLFHLLGNPHLFSQKPPVMRRGINTFSHFVWRPGFKDPKLGARDAGNPIFCKRCFQLDGDWGHSLRMRNGMTIIYIYINVVSLEEQEINRSGVPLKENNQLDGEGSFHVIPSLPLAPASKGEPNLGV